MKVLAAIKQMKKWRNKNPDDAATRRARRQLVLRIVLVGVGTGLVAHRFSRLYNLRGRFNDWIGGDKTIRKRLWAALRKRLFPRADAIIRFLERLKPGPGAPMQGELGLMR
ncbi:unnamed protein product [marine sediment metagenome]|uniref:Uncharacterized protein n=1 Tax=marine sediment metagenome TaxID=412755 RepID=X1K8N8_9ZZZZ